MKLLVDFDPVLHALQIDPLLIFVSLEASAIELYSLLKTPSLLNCLTFLYCFSIPV